MKRDGRSLDHQTLETIRLMAAEQVRDGERPSSVVASYGFNRTTIYRWLSAAATPGVGLRRRPKMNESPEVFQSGIGEREIPARPSGA
jgi:DNA invertase Pin-like site-specific DNA recombinase